MADGLCPIVYCLLPIAYCLLPISCCLLPGASRLVCGDAHYTLHTPHIIRNTNTKQHTTHNSVVTCCVPGPSFASRLDLLTCPSATISTAMRPAAAAAEHIQLSDHSWHILGFATATEHSALIDAAMHPARSDGSGHRVVSIASVKVRHDASNEPA